LTFDLSIVVCLIARRFEFLFRSESTSLHHSTQSHSLYLVSPGEGGSSEIHEKIKSHRIRGRKRNKYFSNSKVYNVEFYTQFWFAASRCLLKCSQFLHIVFYYFNTSLSLILRLLIELHASTKMVIFRVRCKLQPSRCTCFV
jgi:hypothetical protein